MGVKASLSPLFVLSLETGIRYAFTDNIDGSLPENPALQRGAAYNNDWYVFTGFTFSYTLAKFRVIAKKKMIDQTTYQSTSPLSWTEMVDGLNLKGRIEFLDIGTELKQCKQWLKPLLDCKLSTLRFMLFQLKMESPRKGSKHAYGSINQVFKEGTQKNGKK